MNYRFVDLFCGGGGSISGTITALKEAGMAYEGRGFNHWETAISTIHANHPEIVPDYRLGPDGRVISRACAPIESVMPDEIFDTDPTRIDSIWASPSCTHHSVAAAGVPKSNQLRAQPEHLLPYLRLTKCRRMYVENVKELRNWGPLLDEAIDYKGRRYKAGSADPRKKGVFFNLWYQEVKASGYDIEMAVMNAADYGAATSRERLIIQAVRKSAGEKIIWPVQTHAKNPSNGYLPWRSASDIIDWSIKGQSIFDRKKPLCPNTMRRIEAGIRKYWGDDAEPFLVVLRGTTEAHLNSSAWPLSRPLPTVTTEGTDAALIRPFWLDRSHTTSAGVSGAADSPLNTITCSRGTHCVIQPLFVPQHGGGTVKPTGNPLATIATTGSIGIVEPFLIQYYGNSSHASINNPIPTICTRDRFGVIEGRILSLPDGRKYRLDISHRMLVVKELAAATGFSLDYIFCGGDTAAKKQIGNAVCPDIARALYRAKFAA